MYYENELIVFKSPSDLTTQLNELADRGYEACFVLFQGDGFIDIIFKVNDNNA